MSRPPSLTDTQRREVARLRSAGRQYKEIARILGITPDQAKDCWHRFCAASGIALRARDRSRQRINRGLRKILAGNVICAALTEAEQLEIARRALSIEIAVARTEAASAAPFKVGDLQW